MTRIPIVHKWHANIDVLFFRVMQRCSVKTCRAKLVCTTSARKPLGIESLMYCWDHLVREISVDLTRLILF